MRSAAWRCPCSHIWDGGIFLLGTMEMEARGEMQKEKKGDIRNIIRRIMYIPPRTVRRYTAAQAAPPTGSRCQLELCTPCTWVILTRSPVRMRPKGGGGTYVPKHQK